MADIKATLVKEKETPKAAVYTGTYRLVNAVAVPLIPIDGVYSPVSKEDFAELEFQVTRGVVTKS